MAKNDDVILRGKALKDLRGIKDVLLAQGDPFLANIMNRAIECIENQPAQDQVQAMLTMAEKYSNALKDLAARADCEFCKHDYRNKATDEPPTCLADCGECAETCVCSKCEKGSEWVWRGSSV